VAVDRARGTRRAIAVVPPFARDFTVDARRRALVMSNRDDADPHLWCVERVDLATGRRVRLATARDAAPAPFALPDGALALSAAARRGLSVLPAPAFDRALRALGAASDLAGELARAASRVAPRGDGFDVVAAAGRDGAWTAVVHSVDGAADETVALHLPTRTVLALGASDERVEPLGFADACAEVAR